MVTLKECMEQTDELMHDVFNTFGGSGGRPLTPEFSELLDKGVRYRNARDTANNHRDHGVLTQEVEGEAAAAQRSFAETCLEFIKKHPELLSTRGGK